MHPNLPTRVGGEGEGAQNASTRICNFPKNKVFNRKREVVGWGRVVGEKTHNTHLYFKRN